MTCGSAMSAPQSDRGARLYSSTAVSPLAPAFRRNQTLFRSALVTIVDTACPLEHRGCGLEPLRDNHRLVLTRAGSAVSRLADAPAPGVVSDATQALLLSAGETYRVRHSSDDSHECTTFAFARAMLSADDDRLVRRLGRFDAESPNARRMVSPASLLRYHRLRHALLRKVASASISTLAVEDEALGLLHDTLAGPAASLRSGGPIGALALDVAHGMPAVDPRTRRRRRALAESAKALLAGEPGAAHPLAELASSLGVSPSHLSHVFRAEAGMPLHQYLLQMRMALALDRLGEGATDLSRLAVDLGFNTHSHFTAAFRHCFGMTPSGARTLLESTRRTAPRAVPRSLGVLIGDHA